MKKHTIVLAAFLLTWTTPLTPASLFDFRFDRLVDALGVLPSGDRATTEEVIRLIKKGDHQEALTRLNDLNRANPENSSLRLLTGYAMLELGNMVGALEQAEHAHEAPNGNSYKCWFFSKVAFLNGKAEACKRELKHVKKAGDMPQEARALEQELKATRKKG